MNCFATRLSALLVTTLLGTAAAQEEIPVPGVLDTDVKPGKAAVLVAFEAPKQALVVLGASLSPVTQMLRPDLPPILVHFDVVDFRLASGHTELELPRWIAIYYAQCGVLDLASYAMQASRVIEVATLLVDSDMERRAAPDAPATVQADYGDATDDKEPAIH